MKKKTTSIRYYCGLPFEWRQTQGVNFFSMSHLAPKYFKVVTKS